MARLLGADAFVAVPILTRLTSVSALVVADNRGKNPSGAGASADRPLSLHGIAMDNARSQ